jgi:DNA polymerase III alpha subunit
MGKKLLKEYPEFSDATRMEGHPHNPSQHAAGIVITNSPVTDFVAIDARTKSTMCDKKDAEDLNLLKIDALGLTQLSIFERCLELIGKKPVSGYLETIPLNDKKAFDVLNKGYFSGIFQFMGMALQSLTKQIVVESLEDIVSITALARPGPMATGGAGQWVNRRVGAEKITTITPLLTELTKETYGVVVYQEQVMNIVRTLGKMSWEDTSTIRKAMSKSLGDEFFEKYWQKFKKGAKENGIDEKLAKGIWDQVNKFGSWAFNRSHAVAYGIVSYWCCYLKAHHPLEFAAATLDAQSDPLRQIELLRELSREGISYVPVDKDYSTDKWAINKAKRLLVGPLTQIKGIGPATVAEILECRKKKTNIRPKLLERLMAAKTEIDTLFPIRDRIAAIHPDLQEINIFSKPTDIKDVQCGIKETVMILAVATRIAPRDENDAQNVQKRGYEYSGPTQALNMFFRDDTDEIFCKIDRYKYQELGLSVIERGRPGKSLYAVKGTVPPRFRMISVQQIKYLGDLKEDGEASDQD